MDFILTMVWKGTILRVYASKTGERTLELDYFKDILFDLINDWDHGVLNIYENGRENLLWVVMDDGSVFRLHCEKEPFNLFKPPE